MSSRGGGIGRCLNWFRRLIASSSDAVCNLNISTEQSASAGPEPGDPRLADLVISSSVLDR